MKNMFDLTEEEQKQYDIENEAAKREFESLNLNLYTLDEFDTYHWHYFISTLEHYNKSWGAKKLFERLSDEYLDSLDEEYMAYAVAYAEWCSIKYNTPLPENIVNKHSIRLKKTLMDPWMLRYIKDGRYIRPLDQYKTRVSEFDAHNIICKEVNTVINAPG